MSERSELFSPPDLYLPTPGPPEGGYEPRSPFFAYFLWQSKESERLPGRPRQTKFDRRKKRISNAQNKAEQRNQR